MERKQLKPEQQQRITKYTNTRLSSAKYSGILNLWEIGQWIGMESVVCLKMQSTECTYMLGRWRFKLKNISQTPYN